MIRDIQVRIVVNRFEMLHLAVSFPELRSLRYLSFLQRSFFIYLLASLERPNSTWQRIWSFSYSSLFLHKYYSVYWNEKSISTLSKLCAASTLAVYSFVNHLSFLNSLICLSTDSKMDLNALCAAKLQLSYSFNYTSSNWYCIG